MQWILQKITQPVLAPNFLNILIQKVTGVLEDVLNTPTLKKTTKKTKKNSYNDSNNNKKSVHACVKKFGKDVIQLV